MTPQIVVVWALIRVSAAGRNITKMEALFSAETLTIKPQSEKKLCFFLNVMNSRYCPVVCVSKVTSEILGSAVILKLPLAVVFIPLKCTVTA